MDKDQAAMIGLRMSAATGLIGRVLIELDLTEDERGALGDILEMISQQLADSSVKHFMN